MSAQPIPPVSRREKSLALQLVHRLPKLRALAWDGNQLYASHGYELLQADIGGGNFHWQTVASYSPAWWRTLTVSSGLSFRLCRDGFHALAKTTTGHLVAAVPGAILSLAPGEKEFRPTHKIARGTRPLHLAVTPAGHIFWGEYFDNPGREEVYIYGSMDCGETWNVVYTLPRGAIRHVHNIVYDRWAECLWILTGDDGSECRILRASPDFRQVDVVMEGNQQIRAVALLPRQEALYFSSDTPSEKNHIYRLDRQGRLSAIADVSSSSIYGCQVGDAMFFSTMVEPSAANPDHHARLYGSLDRENWSNLASWKKDIWPMRLFQFGNVVLPDGVNSSQYLALTTIAVQGATCETSLWRLNTN